MLHSLHRSVSQGKDWRLYAVICRVGLALLKTAEEELLALPFEQLLAALNSKRFPALSRSPGQLIKVAMSIKVSRRLTTSEWEYRRAKGTGLSSLSLQHNVYRSCSCLCVMCQ